MLAPRLARGGPQLTEAPVLDQEKGMLNIKGYFPTTPVQINFEMLFQSVAGRWRLFGLSVQPSNAAPPPAPASPGARVARTGAKREQRCSQEPAIASETVGARRQA
jgi:hypothetical protein